MFVGTTEAAPSSCGRSITRRARVRPRSPPSSCSGSSSSSSSSSSNRGVTSTLGTATPATTTTASALLLSLAVFTSRFSSSFAQQAAPPACSPASVEMTVSTAVQLATLVESTNCSDGAFVVSWQGALTLSEPVVVGNSTTLSIEGVGDGAVLDGRGGNRLFQVSGGASLFLENLELRNASAPYYSGGGAIYADGEDVSLLVSSCNFTGNRAPLDGGAILSTGAGSIIALNDCRFEGNTAEHQGGAVMAISASAVTARKTLFLANVAEGPNSDWDDFDVGVGGAVGLSGGTLQLAFHECELRHNNATGGGGAVYSDSGASITVNSTLLDGNWAGGYGGGVYANGGVAQVDVLDSVFTGNFASDMASWSSSVSHAGGALYVIGQAAVSIKSSSFTGNGAEGAGAAYFDGSNSISVEGSSFVGNLGNAQGGGIMINNEGPFDVNFTDTVFSDNWSGGNGGGLWAFLTAGKLTLLRTNFSNNAVAYREGFFDVPNSHRGGGVWVSGNGEMVVQAEGCHLEGNEADAQGGGMAVDGGVLRAAGCGFSGNVAGRGGAIAAAGEDDDSAAVVFVSGGYMRGNSAELVTWNLWYGYGGGLFAQDGAQAVLEGVVLDGNSAGFGGGVSLSAGSAVSATGGTNFTSNVAEVGGGAVNAWGSGSSFWASEGCGFTGNVAGGAAAAARSTSSGSDSSGDSYSPTVDPGGPAGGAIYVTNGGAVSVLESKLSGNSAHGRGGGLYCAGDANVTVARTGFAGHESGVGGVGEAHGGACAAVAGCSLDLQDSTFTDNRALGTSGGAVSAENGSDVTAAGCVFADNQAGGGGGGVYGTGEETRVIVESSSFTGNAAEKVGGGLRAFLLGVLRTESSRFDGNHAGEQGGGIHCFECALWAVNSTFEGNTATGDGGGMTVSSASTANINFCRFIDNSAVYDGGAISVDTVSGGYSSGEDTSASMQALNATVDDESSVDLLCRNTTFVGNIAGERGGSLYSNTDSRIEMQDCNSTFNSASLGGSIYMSRSELGLRNCLFVGDTVPTGAIVYTLGARVRARDSVFEDTTNNTGMLAVQAGSHTEFEAQDCSFVGWAGNNVVLADQTGMLHLDGCDFSESTASGMVNVQDGGTLAVVRNARLGTSNYQAINYGADLETPLEAENSSVSIFGSNIAGCELSGCSDNEGCIEGDLGVYCYCYVSVVDTTSACLGSSGTLTLTGPDSVVSTTYPDAPSTSLVLSWNDSEALGADSQDGAGESGVGAGLWEIVWLDDPRSVAWVVVPSTGLAFPGEDITISLKGEVSTYWNGESTTVFTAEAPHQEEVDPFATSINATFVYCNAGQYWVASETSCMMCADVALNPEGLNCDSEGTLLETLPLAEGYWRSTETSTNIRECFNDDACIGSEVSQRISSPNDYCDTGYMGPYCAVCMDGYTIGVSHTCHSCHGSYWAGMVVVMALTGVALVVGVVIVLNDLVGNPALTDLSETHFSVMSRRIRTMPFHKLKIPFVVLQIITQYASITSIEFAPVFQTFLSTISVINLDLGWVLTSLCIIDVNFYGNLLAATVGPLMVLLVLAVTYFYTCKKHRLEPRPRETDDQAIYPMSSFRTSPNTSSENDTAEPNQSVMRRVQDKYTTVALTMAFFLYSTVSTVIFQTFSCDELEDVGKSYLRADYGIDCDSDRHKAFKLYAGLMILVYPIGIPVAFAVMLWRKRSMINPPKDVLSTARVLHGSNPSQHEDERYGRPSEPDQRLSDRRIAQTAFLWRAYRPAAYYYEVLECFRRLLLTGCLVFILPNSAGQAAVACVLAVLTVAVFAFVSPYSDPDDHRAYTLGALAIFLTMFMGLVVRVDLADEETQSQLVLGVLLILLTIGLVVVAVAECLWETRRVSRGNREADGRDDHIFLRRRRGDRKRKDGGGMGGGTGKGGAGDLEDKFRTSGSLYAPKLEDVPMNRAFGASRNSGATSAPEVFDAEKAAAAAAVAAAGAAGGGGPRPRGSQVFMLSSAGQDKKAHVAFAGTSNNVHPSVDTGTGGIGGAAPSFPAYRGTAGSSGIGEMGLRSSSGSHSPIHPRRDAGGGSSGYPGMVPAEAESAPPGVVEMEPAPQLPVAGGGGGGGEGDGARKKRTKKRSSKSRRDRGRGRSSSSRRLGGGDGGMRPAVPDAGPEMDEMRPSPGDGTGAPGPWMS